MLCFAEDGVLVDIEFSSESDIAKFSQILVGTANTDANPVIEVKDGALRLSKMAAGSNYGGSVVYYLDQNITSGKVYVEYKIRTDTVSHTLYLVNSNDALTGAASSANCTRVLVNGSSNFIINTSANLIGECAPGEWYNVKLVLDLDAKTCTASIDGGEEKIVSGGIAALGALQIAHFASASAGYVDYDYIRVSTVGFKSANTTTSASGTTAATSSTTPATSDFVVLFVSGVLISAAVIVYASKKRTVG